MITSFCLRYKQNTWHNRFLVCTGTFFLQTWVSKTAAADRGSSSRQLEHWGLITSDQWLLNTLSRGYYLQFQYQPPPKTEVWDLNQFILLVEVQSPLEKTGNKNNTRTRESSGLFLHISDEQIPLIWRMIIKGIAVTLSTYSYWGSNNSAAQGKVPVQLYTWYRYSTEYKGTLYN